MTTGLKTPNSYYIELITAFPPRPITKDLRSNKVPTCWVEVRASPTYDFPSSGSLFLLAKK